MHRHERPAGASLDRLKGASTSILRRLEGEAGELEFKELSGQGYTSRRAVIADPSGTAKYCVKAFMSDEVAGHRMGALVLREFTGLRIGHRLFEGHPRFVVPEPVGRSRDEGLLVMRFLAGRNLLDLLVEDRGTRNPDLPAILRDCGRMLYTLQDGGYRIEAPTSRRLERLHAYYRDTFEQGAARARSHGGDARLLSELGIRVDVGLADLFGRPVELGYQHVDYRPQNFIVGEKLGLVDFMLFGRGSPYFDLAAFACTLRYMSVLRPLWRTRLRELEAHFMDGYREAWQRELPFSERTFDLFLALLFPFNYNLFLIRLPSGGVRALPGAIARRVVTRRMRTRLARP